MLGLLRHRINIKRKEKVPDGQGGWTEKLTDVGTFWAGIFPLSARERVMYQSILPETDTKIVMRYMEDVDTGCVIECKDRIFKIDGVIIPSLKKRFVEILATEVEDKG